ncbi:MAG: SAM-dependent methyltransferase [Buchnera aphidicola (Schlechtendalia peitan)]
MVSKVRSSSSKKWLKRHVRDQYVILAYKKSVRSRAYFKLDDINKRNKLLNSGMTVIDLGSSPGSWSEYASKHIGKSGRIIACDILPMLPIKNVSFFQGDVRNSVFLNFLLSFVQVKVDLVMSDMAPNMSGSHCIDHPRSLELSRLAFKISMKVLCNHGKLVVKSFYGEQFNALVEEIRTCFIQVKIFKPNASRTCSKEVYIIASGRTK